MSLSITENHILVQIAEGRTNKMIASSLNLAPGTVRNYISALMDKLNCENRASLAAYATKNRIAESRFWEAPAPVVDHSGDVMELYARIATHSHATAAKVIEVLHES